MIFVPHRLTTRAIYIDSQHHRLDYIQIEKLDDGIYQIYEILEGHCGIAFLLPNRDICYVSHEILRQKITYGFSLKSVKEGQIYLGNAVLVGGSDRGRIRDVSSTIEGLTAEIAWVSGVDLKEWFAEPQRQESMEEDVTYIQDIKKTIQLMAKEKKTS